MSLDRYNIFDLIGKHQSRYEHAIITTFTFDFLFFEERVMRALRSANVRNINVLVDANFLEQAIERVDEAAFIRQRVYSLIPVDVSGIFHPKIMLLLGKNEGLLIVGSGNFTSSGISTNDEVWGAFHLDHVESKNAPLFAAVWNYLQRFTKQGQGFHKQKFEWITQKAPWLKDLKKVTSSGFFELNSLESIAFVANASGNSTLAQLKTLLPPGKVRCLTVVSPYFDAKGQGLKDLKEAFDIQAFHCITDVEYGLLPYSIDSQLQDEIIFVDWQDCLKEFERKFNRLHAKIFHFAYEDGHEYLLIGSANATQAGLGSLGGDTSNEEAGLLLRCVPGGNYLNDLGIQVDKSKAISVQGREPRFESQGDNLERKAYQNRILYAQRLGNQLTLGCKEPVDTSVQLGVHPRPLDPAVMYPLQSPTKEFTVVLDQPDLPQVAALYRGSKRISPFAYIDDIGLLSKTNPDARQAAISDVIDALKEDPNAEGYAELLKSQEYDWIDDEDNYSNSGKNLSFYHSTTTSKLEQTHEAINETAFNNLSSVQLHEAVLLSDSTAQIADLLNLISKGLVVPKVLFESAEQQLIESKAAGQDGKENEAVSFKETSNTGEKESLAIDRYLDKLVKWFRRSLEGFLNNGNLANSPSRPISIKDLNKVMMALDLLNIFCGKKYNKIYGRFGLSSENEFQPDLIKLTKQYRLKSLEYYDKTRPKYIFYELESKFFEAFKKDISNLSPSKFYYQEANPIQRKQCDYFSEGIIHETYVNELKYNLQSVLSSFLLCANRNAGFKYYDYAPAKEREQQTRLLIFQKSAFLLLNLNWSEKEVLYRDLMLLDLLHNINPATLQIEDISGMKESIHDYYGRSQKKHPNFEANLEWFTTRLVPQYLRWRSIFDSENKSSIQKPVVSVSNGEWVYHSRLSFACVFRRGVGYLELQKAGFDFDAERGVAVQKIEFPFERILVFPGS